MPRILIVEDDQELREALVYHFTGLGHTLDACGSGEDALKLLSTSQYDLIVQDWSLPGISGKEVCQQFRQKGGQAPIIFLTGQGDIDSKEAGLEAGADDYLVKPFDIKELSARIRALLKRRTGALLADQLEVGGMLLNVQARTITAGDKVVELRGKEFSLLEFLMRNTNRLYSAQQLIDALWASDAELTTGAVRTQMNLLRQKLAEVGKPDLIETVARSGYIIRS